MICKSLIILALTLLAIYFCEVILTKQPPKQQEYEEFGAYFFNQ